MVQGLQKVGVGQSMGSGFPAHVYNAMIDLINAHRKGQLTNLGVGRDTIRSAGIVRVQNNSGSARARMEILGIDAPLILPTADALEFKDRVRMVGVEPTSDHVPEKFVVLLEPLQNGEVGLACIEGVVQCQVNITSASHQFAAVKASTTANLESTDYGGARMLWQESGTGLKHAVVHLAPPLVSAIEIDGTECEETLWNGSLKVWPGSRLEYSQDGAAAPSWTAKETIYATVTNVCDDTICNKIRGNERFVGYRCGYWNGRWVYVFRNPDHGKVRVNKDDELDFLEDQYEDHVAAGTYATGDLLVKSQTDDVGGDKMVRRFVDAAGYNSNQQFLTHPGGDETPTWGDAEEITVITDLRIYNYNIEKRTARVKAIGLVDEGWSVALPATEC